MKYDLLELVLVQQCRIEIGDAECREVRCQPRCIGNLKRAVGGAGHQREARVGIENGRDIGKAALLRRMIVDRRPVRRRIFKSDIALEEPPSEEILGLTDLAAILEARREGLPRAAIDAHRAAVEGIVAGLDVEHARGAQAELRRQRAGNQRYVADQRGIEKRAEAGNAVRQHDAVDADLHIGVLVADVKAAAGGGILRHAGGLQEYLFDRLIVAPRKRLDRVVTDGRRNGPDRRVDRVQSLVEGVRRRGDRIDRRCSGHRRRRRWRRRWTRSGTHLYGLGFRLFFLLRRRDDDLRKLGLRGCRGSKAERRSDGRTAKRAAARSAKSKHGHQNSFLIAATNGQTAGSIAGRAVAADRK